MEREPSRQGQLCPGSEAHSAVTGNFTKNQSEVLQPSWDKYLSSQRLRAATTPQLLNRDGSGVLWEGVRQEPTHQGLTVDPASSLGEELSSLHVQFFSWRTRQIIPAPPPHEVKAGAFGELPVVGSVRSHEQQTQQWPHNNRGPLPCPPFLYHSPRRQPLRALDLPNWAAWTLSPETAP